MKNIKLSKIWDSLHSSYWFLPGLMAIGGMVLAFGTLTFDQTKSMQMSELRWIYTGGPDGARGLLSAVAGSMVTVAATAFSITIVALQLAAANFGPRLLRTFMQDRGNQLVLGTFIATFVYSLLVLRTIRGQDYNLFVPQLSVTVGMGLAIASIGVLIFFIHHASTIIQVSHVIWEVAKDLDSTIDRLFPEAIGQGEGEVQQPIGEIPRDFDARAYPVHASKTGYLQMIDDELLLKIATHHNLLLRLKSKPGEFIVKGKPLVMVYPEAHVTTKALRQLKRSFILGRERTEQQDIGFPIDQLVEIALRALSPSVNDPFTAIRCIDRLGAGLTELVQRPVPSAYRYDDARTLRVVAEPVQFEVLFDAAFSQIRHYGASDLAVALRLIQAIALIATHTQNHKYRFVLKQHADMIRQKACEQLTEAGDRQKIESSYQTFLVALGSKQAETDKSSYQEMA